MRSFDLSPLFRSTVGFDRLSRLMDAAARIDDQAFSYPPYDIEKKGEDSYRIVMAVAGFADEDLEITAQANLLTIAARPAKTEEAEGQVYLHRGIAKRAFERRFELADHIKVTGAKLENGLLSVDLVREVPEAMKPRAIKIESKPASRVLESKAA